LQSGQHQHDQRRRDHRKQHSPVPMMKRAVYEGAIDAQKGRPPNPTPSKREFPKANAVDPHCSNVEVRSSQESGGGIASAGKKK